MQRTLLVFVRCIVFVHAFAGLLIAQTPGPSMSLNSPLKTAWETDQSLIDLRGTASAKSGLSNVLWVNQLGKRGAGTWTAAGEGKANWTVEGIPLRPGANLIAVTVVDTDNLSATLHLAINRKIATGTQAQPLEVHTGTWKNQPIVYQLWNGMPVVEGDIILGPVLVQSGAPAAGLASEQAVKPSGIAVNYTSQLWPSVGGVFQVPYIITGSSTNLNTALTNFNTKFSGLLQFVSRTTQTNYVNITVQAGGGGEGFSNVGVAGGEQTLSCGDGCTVATWIHEMGHTVGLLHEHQRPDRTSYITLNLANADLPNVPGNFTLFNFDYQTLGLYDHASVMHYAAFDFSKAGLPVIESIPAGIPLSNETGYSTGDIDTIERLYGATPSAVTVTTNPPGLKVVVDNVTYTAPQTFNWPLNSSHTVNAPADPQTTSPSDGSTYAFGVWNDLGARSHTITVRPGAGALTTPATKPAVTVYEANFIRLQPFAFMTPAVFPSGAGTVGVSPAPTSEFGGSFFTDRTLVTLTLTPTAGSGYNFYDWFNLPFPPSDNPHVFFIQAPTTQAQAVFVPTPVTIVGKSILGPNTWNPGLAGSVDGNFAFLPTGFSPTYNGTAWNGGTSHTIAVNQTQSPVTTNVFYNWDTWSDGLGMSHSITQPASGSQTISASFTPFYAFYTVPPPLGGANSSCYGGVTTTPVGTPYSANTVFDFYADGTSVTATATANPDFPGMVFAGWSGSLSGNTNPQMTTIHDQFVPTANFNTIATPITITSLSPATAPATSSAMDVIIKGTGFTSNTTFVYWNNSFRSSTFVSSTQLILHLNAGDLANRGGQDIFVGNYITNASKNTCGVGAESSLTVTTPPPTVVSLTPNSGTGAAQTFSAVVSDPSGLSDLRATRVLFNTTSANQTSACSVYYLVGSNQLYIYNDAGTAWSAAVTPGSTTTVSNSQCTLAGKGSSFSKSGNNLTLNVALTFTSTFIGLKNVYLYASGNDGLNTGWVQKGTWTPGKPQVVSLTPNSGSGVAQTFSAVVSDPGGLSSLRATRVLFNTTSANQTSACSVYYLVGSNQLYLYDDTGTTWSLPVTPGSTATASNSQCLLTGTGSSFSKSGNNLTLNVALNFTIAFTGLKNVYVYASVNDGSNTGWVKEGTWNPSVVQVRGLSPNVANASTHQFTQDFTDPYGFSDMKTIQFLVNTTSANSANACSIFYSVATNQISLYNDAGTALSASITGGTSATVSNSQCAVNGMGTGIAKQNPVPPPLPFFNLNVTFSPTFAGTRNIYVLGVGTKAVSSGFVLKGTWSPGVLLSMAPTNGSGMAATFSVKLSDADGLSLKTTQLVFRNDPTAQSHACSIYFSELANQLYLYDDLGQTLLGPLTPGHTGTLANSQCSLNAVGASVSKNSTSVTLKVPVTFAATFNALQQAWVFASKSDGSTTGWNSVGTWLP